MSSRSRASGCAALLLTFATACGGSSTPEPSSSDRAKRERAEREKADAEKAKASRLARLEGDDSAEPMPESVVKVTFEPLVTGVRPGRKFLIAARFKIARGYRISWSNAGDVGKDTVVKGELKSTTDMLIEGRVEGQIQGANRVIIGETGDVEALVEAQVVTVRGTVRGNCQGTKKVEITSTGKVFGDIASRAIVVAEGATFKGASKMTQAEPETKPENPAARLPDTPAQPAPPGIAPAPSTGVN